MLRLKEQVGLHMDKEVGALLGMTEKAFHARKTRDSFPEDKLFALAAKRPDLGIDVNYVLTGETTVQTVKRMQANLPARVREQRGGRAPEEFAHWLGVSTKELQEVEAGRATPSAAFQASFVKAFPQMSPAYLSGGEAPKLVEPMSHVEVLLVQHFRASSEIGQRALVHQAEFFAADQRRGKPTAAADLYPIDLAADYNPPQLANTKKAGAR